MSYYEPIEPDEVDTTPTSLGAERLLKWLAALLVVSVLGLFSWTAWNGKVAHVDRVLPPLPIQTLRGDAIDLADMRTPPTVLHVWLPGCGKCAAEAPAYERVRARYAAQGVRFLSVSVLADPELTRRAAAEFGIGGALATTTGNVLQALEIYEVPSTVWISGDGRVVAVGAGPLAEHVLDRETARILR